MLIATIEVRGHSVRYAHPGATESASSTGYGRRGPTGEGDVVTPGWYYPLVAVLTGGTVASFAAPQPLVFMTALILYFLILIVLDSVIGHKSVLTARLSTAAEAGRQAIAPRFLLIIAMVLGVVPKIAFNWDWAPIVAGLAVVPAMIVLGRRSDQELRARASQPT